TFLEQRAAAPVVNPDRPAATDGLDLDAVREEPPEEMPVTKEPGKPWRSRRGRRIDFAHRDALNRLLGRLGEEFVVLLERRRPRLAGRDDLAATVQWASETLGDGLGIDVLSFDDADDSERLRPEGAGLRPDRLAARPLPARADAVPGDRQGRLLIS